MRDGRLQQRGQAPVSHLHQAGHPGLVLLFAGRRPLPRGVAAAGPPPLPSPPALAAGRDPLLLFPRRARWLRFLPASAAPAPPSAPSSPGPSGTGAEPGARGGGARSAEAMWAGSGSGLVQGGPVPAAHVSAGAGAARCAGYPGQVGRRGKGAASAVRVRCRSSGHLWFWVAGGSGMGSHSGPGGIGGRKRLAGL